MTGDSAAQQALAGILRRLLENDGAHPDYEVRNHLVLAAAAAAQDAGYYAGIRLDPDEPRWPVVYIELPTGQVSWHLPEHLFRWDAHTKPVAHARVRAWLEETPAPPDGGWG